MRRDKNNNKVEFETNLYVRNRRNRSKANLMMLHSDLMLLTQIIMRYQALALDILLLIAVMRMMIDTWRFVRRQFAFARCHVFA